MMTTQITAAGRSYTFDATDRTLRNSRNQVTARVMVFKDGRMYLNRLPGGWTERDWNNAINQIEANS